MQREARHSHINEAGVPRSGAMRLLRGVAAVVACLLAAAQGLKVTPVAAPKPVVALASGAPPAQAAPQAAPQAAGKPTAPTPAKR